VRTSINTNTRVGPLATREDGLSEGESKLISSIFACLPDIRSKALGKERFSSRWEIWKSLDVIPISEV
jgi:hypothetical protein